MEPTQSSNPIRDTNREDVQSSFNRERNRNYYRNWIQRITPEQAAQNRQRSQKQQQLRIQNTNQADRNARLEGRRTTERSRRTTLAADHMGRRPPRSRGRNKNQHQEQTSQRSNLQMTGQSNLSTSTNAEFPTSNQEGYYPTIGTCILTYIDRYAPILSIHEQGSSSNSRPTTDIIASPYNVRNVSSRPRIYGVGDPIDHTHKIPAEIGNEIIRKYKRDE